MKNEELLACINKLDSMTASELIQFLNIYFPRVVDLIEGEARVKLWESEELKAYLGTDIKSTPIAEIVSLLKKHAPAVVDVIQKETREKCANELEQIACNWAYGTSPKTK